MRYLTKIALLLVAAIHLLPVVGVLGRAQLTAAYGIAIADANLEILMRHRAVLFGVVAGLCLAAVCTSRLTVVALVTAFTSVVSFLVLAHAIGGYSELIGRIVIADYIALAALMVAAMSYIASRRQG